MNQDDQEPKEDMPLEALATLEQEVSPRFMAKVREKIYRRTTANQMVAFSWNLPKVILMELLMMISDFFKSAGREKKA